MNQLFEFLKKYYDITVEIVDIEGVNITWYIFKKEGVEKTKHLKLWNNTIVGFTERVFTERVLDVLNDWLS